jgi:hypothetical protein
LIRFYLGMALKYRRRINVCEFRNRTFSFPWIFVSKLHINININYVVLYYSSVTNITVYQCNISLSFPTLSLFLTIPRKTSRGSLTPYKIQTEHPELPLNVEHQRFNFVANQTTSEEKGAGW